MNPMLQISRAPISLHPDLLSLLCEYVFKILVPQGTWGHQLRFLISESFSANLPTFAPSKKVITFMTHRYPLLLHTFFSFHVIPNGLTPVLTNRDLLQISPYECPGSFLSLSVHTSNILKLPDPVALVRRIQQANHRLQHSVKAQARDRTNKMNKKQRWRYLLDRKCSLQCPAASSHPSSVCSMSILET